MNRVGVPVPMHLASRTLLAMTCRICGQLRQGHEYGRRGDGYVDRRCRTTCRWRVMEASPGR